ncbi:MAG: paraquat-inducible protein A [Azospirillaceae bacterium]|nr:paraquat-inducible protein A [Azospirillaceae bacterium]
MKTFLNLVICEHCDSVYRRGVPAPGEVAHCAQCAAVLYRASRLDVEQWLALTAAAVVAFMIANICPVVRISLQGQHNEAALWQSVAALAHGAAAPIAVPMALCVILVPLMQIVLLVWVLPFARVGRRAPGFAPAMRILVALRPWSMVEVGLLGILVATIKLSSFVEVAPGAGIWATAALTVLLIVIAKRDVQGLWALTERAAPGPMAPA